MHASCVRKRKHLPKQISAVALSSLIQQVRWFSRKRLIALFWFGAVITAVVMACVGPVGWDAQVYWKAIQVVRHGSDPYVKDIAYSPMTLPLLRLLAVFPGWLLGLLYGAAVATGALLQLWAGFQMAARRERRWLALMLPAAAFFPGLVTDDVILSGNVAYVLYGAILVAATAGWKRDRWFWYYIAVLVASVFKAPFLAFLAFPVLMDRRQWVPSGMTAVTGVLIFAAQMRLWPDMFRENLLHLQSMLDGGTDFGFGPAGTLGRALWRRGLPFSPATYILYLAVACVLGTALLFLARRVQEWNLPRKTWVPIALAATALLNPRIMKYDLAAITVPMLLIGWRALRFAWGSSAGERQEGNSCGTGQNRSGRALILVGSGCFLIPNVITVAGPSWFPVELLVLFTVFAMGVWSLYQYRPEVQPLVAPMRTPAEYPGEVLVGQEP